MCALNTKHSKLLVKTHCVHCTDVWMVYVATQAKMDIGGLSSSINTVIRLYTDDWG
jgi:hypothetical protein